MVKIGDVFLGIRSRLGDTDVTKYRYSDPEIMDAVNSALAHLSEDLLCFHRTWVLACFDGVGRYELPSDFLRLISVNYKGMLITEVESMEHRTNRSEGTPGVSLDLQTIHVFPSESIKESDRIEVYYCHYERVDGKEDVVSLPHVAKEAMVFFALSLLYQNPIQKAGIEKSNYYRKMYGVELESLRSRVRMNAQSRKIRSRHIKV